MSHVTATAVALKATSGEWHTPDRHEVVDFPVARHQQSPVVPACPSFVVIDRRPLIGQCFLAALQRAEPSVSFEGFPSVAAWERAAAHASADAVLLCLPGGLTPEKEREQIVQHLAELRTWNPDVSVAVMSDCESPAHVAQVLKLGIKGYIATSDALEIAVQALQLVRAGGYYVPVACMVGVLESVSITENETPNDLALSPRQVSVARALRKGTPNKIIAYELNMCESTVKVHVREIMKKLKAKNRTEVAYLTNKYFESRKESA
jgi:DNA-binding NarL/FixJ family response regulator